jgi:hypothetical protein
METTNSIDNTLQQIKEQTGMSLTLCDYFTGIKTGVDKKEYFNVLLSEPIYAYMGIECNEYGKLKGLVKSGVISDVAPNGVKRVAIYF